MYQSDGRLLPLLALAIGLVISGACVLWAHGQTSTITASEALVAAAAGEPVVIEHFLADGGDPNITNAEGLPLLHLTVGGMQDGAVLDLLLARGADPNLKSRGGKTALMRAAESCAIGHVVQLLEAGARVGPLDSEGRGALDMVCRGPGRHEILGLLRRKLFQQALSEQ